MKVRQISWITFKVFIKTKKKFKKSSEDCEMNHEIEKRTSRPTF